MNFTETDEQLALRAAVAGLAAGYGYAYYTEQARSGGRLTELWQEAGRLGFIGVNLPEEYGGGGAGCTSCLSWQAGRHEGGRRAEYVLLKLIVTPAEAFVHGSIDGHVEFGGLEARRCLRHCAGRPGSTFAFTEVGSGWRRP